MRPGRRRQLPFPLSPTPALGPKWPGAFALAFASRLLEGRELLDFGLDLCDQLRPGRVACKLPTAQTL